MTRRGGWCPTGKRRFARRPDALHALATIRARSDADRLPRRVYRCRHCGGGWHLTSQP